MQEQTLEVRKWGNSAGILLPREWLGDKVIVKKIPKKPVKERILEVLSPHLEHIIGAYLYGSRARGEETDDSDIDLFVIADDKIEIKAKGFEINVIERDKFSDSLQGLSALIVYSMLAEAKPIINSELLLQLKKEYVPKLEDFRAFIENTKSMLDVHKSFLDYDLEEGDGYSDDNALAYSLILRLRGIYLIKCLLLNKEYSKKRFDKWVVNNTNVTDYDAVYRVYLSEKDKAKKKQNLLLSDLASLYDLLTKEVKKLEVKLNGKKRKKA